MSITSSAPSPGIVVKTMVRWATTSRIGGGGRRTGNAGLGRKLMGLRTDTDTCGEIGGIVAQGMCNHMLLV